MRPTKRQPRYPRGRGKSKYKQSDIARVWRGAASAGVEVERIDIDPHSGRISVIPKTKEAVDLNRS
jgi:hypothetical protein